MPIVLLLQAFSSANWFGGTQNTESLRLRVQQLCTSSNKLVQWGLFCRFIPSESIAMSLCARFSAFLLVLSFYGCKKDPGPCTGNCELVQVSGIAVNPGTQKPLGGLVVEVDMGRRQNCMYCGPYQVASGKTRGDGTFSFSVEV